MIAQSPFNLPSMPQTAPQLGWWGVLIFAVIIVAVVVYLVVALPRGGEGQDEGPGGPGDEG
jgi:hypothetical protein